MAEYSKPAPFFCTGMEDGPTYTGDEPNPERNIVLKFDGRSITGRAKYFELRPQQVIKTMLRATLNNNDMGLQNQVILRKMSSIPRRRAPGLGLRTKPFYRYHELDIWLKARNLGPECVLPFLGVAKVNNFNTVVLADPGIHSVYDTNHVSRAPEHLRSLMKTLLVGLWEADLEVGCIDPEHVCYLDGRFVMTGFPRTRVADRVGDEPYTFDANGQTDTLVRKWKCILDTPPGMDVWQNLGPHGSFIGLICLRGSMVGKSIVTEDMNSPVSRSGVVKNIARSGEEKRIRNKRPHSASTRRIVDEDHSASRRRIVDEDLGPHPASTRRIVDEDLGERHRASRRRIVDEDLGERIIVLNDVMA